MSERARRGAGRPRDAAAREARRRGILTAARWCFMEQGFDGASVADISEAAGVSVANLYQYFASKQALVLAIAEQELEADLGLGVPLERSAELWDGLAAVFDSLASRAAEGGVFRLRVEIFAAAQRDPEMRAALVAMDARLTRGLARLLARAQHRGQVARDLDVDGAAAAILRLTDGFYLGAGVGLVEGRALIPHLVGLLRRGFGPTPAGG